jgi:hypothetical protein
VQSSETGTVYLVHSSVVVNVNTTQAMLDALASANKVNKVTITTANTATDLAATDLEDGVYRESYRYYCYHYHLHQPNPNLLVQLDLKYQWLLWQLKP